MTIPTPYWRSDCGRYVIYHGDCRDVVPHLVGVQYVITDPPYGIGASGGIGKYGRLKWDATDSGWDSACPELAPIVRMGVPTVVWGGNYFPLPPSRMYLVWNKGAGFQGRDFAECEMAWCSMDGNARVLTRDPLAMRDYANKEHPTQKPVAVMRWCIEQADVPADALVLDPYAGSGSTAVACIQHGCRCVLIEKEQRYCEIAARRIREEANHLFTGIPA